MATISLLDYYKMLKVRGWVYLFRYFIHSHWFDIFRGTNTHFWVSPEEYQQKNSNLKDSVHYVACPTHTIRKCLKAIHNHAGNEFRNYQFLDLGCGKGKALLVYVEYASNLHPPLALGIEAVDSLACIARQNIKTRGANELIKVITDTATNWKNYSTSNYAIIFLYNPFGAKTLRDVLLKVTPAKCYVAYVDPEHSFLLHENSWNKIYEKNGTYKNDNIEIWYRGGL